MYKSAYRHISWKQAIRVGTTAVALALIAVSSPNSAFAQDSGSGTPSQNIVDYVVDAEAGVLARSNKLSVLRDGDWIRWQYATDLGNDPNSRVYYGKKNELGGCSYSGTDMAAYPRYSDTYNRYSSRMLTIERQMVERMEDCIMITEYNVLTIEEAIDKGLLFSNELNEIQKPNINGIDPSASNSDLPPKGSIKIYYEDPPQIDVNSVTTQISWNMESGCIASTHKTSHWGWFRNSGWKRKEYKSNTEPDLCHEAWKNTYGKYQNGVFCAFVDTWTELSATYVVHDGGTAVKASWDADKWGGCTFLLSFHKHFIHPWQV